MPQSIGNHNYQVFAKSSTGAYSSPISINMNVTSCGSSNGAYLSGAVVNSLGITGSLGLYILSPNSNTYPNNIVNSNVYKILKYDANNINLIGVTRENGGNTVYRIDQSGVTATQIINIPSGYNIDDLDIVKSTGDIILGLQSTTTGFPEIRKYSSAGTLIATKQLSATPFSIASVASNFDGTAIYTGTAFNSTGSIRKLDGATLQTELWTQSAFGVVDIIVTQDSREQVWILDNGAAGNANPDIFRKLDKDTGLTLSGITDSPYAYANSFAISPDQRYIYSQVSNTNPSSTKIVKIDTNTASMSTFSTIPGNTILSISKDGTELFSGSFSSGIQVFDTSTGVLKRQYPNTAPVYAILAQ